MSNCIHDSAWVIAEVRRTLGVSASRIRSGFFWGGGLVFACLLAVAEVTAATLPLGKITSSYEYYNLPLESFDQAVPVSIPGQVLYCDLGWRILFMRDTNGTTMYVELPSEGKWPAIEPGDQLLLEGMTGMNRGSRGFSRLQLNVLGPGALPAALPVDVKNLIDPAQGAVFARVRGADSEYIGRRSAAFVIGHWRQAH